MRTSTVLAAGLAINVAANIVAAHGAGIYHGEILRANKVPIAISATDQVIITIQNMTPGDYDCSANGGFDQAPPPGAIYHVKAAISSTTSISAGRAAGLAAMQTPFQQEGTRIAIATGTVRLYNTTTANLIVNAYFDTGTASAFGYLQCVGPQ